MTDPWPDSAEHQPPTTPPGVSGRKAAALFGGIIIAVLAIVGAVWLFAGGDGTSTALSAAPSSSDPESFELRGSMTLTDGATAAGTGECAGYRGYDDITEGAQVIVYDATGKAVALGRLANARYTAGECTFDFAVADVPSGENIYQVEVTHRGKVSFSASDAEAGRVYLTLG